jgi:hypothetical protein
MLESPKWAKSGSKEEKIKFAGNKFCRPALKVSLGTHPHVERRAGFVSANPASKRRQN